MILKNRNIKKLAEFLRAELICRRVNLVRVSRKMGIAEFILGPAEGPDPLAPPIRQTQAFSSRFSFSRLRFMKPTGEESRHSSE